MAATRATLTGFPFQRYSYTNGMARPAKAARPWSEIRMHNGKTGRSPALSRNGGAHPHHVQRPSARCMITRKVPPYRKRFVFNGEQSARATPRQSRFPDDRVRSNHD